MGAPQIIADSLEELRRSIDTVESEWREEYRARFNAERHRAFEQGRRVGYAQGVEDGRGMTQSERDSIYAAGFAEGARLAVKQGVGKKPEQGVKQ